MLALPVFKFLYLLGVGTLADKVGGLLLINAGFLAPFWRFLTSLPVIAYLDLNNTMVTGGLAISGILCFPVYLGSKKGIVALREKYFDKIKDSRFVKWFKKVPIVNKVVALVIKLKRK